MPSMDNIPNINIVGHIRNVNNSNKNKNKSNYKTCGVMPTSDFSYHAINKIFICFFDILIGIISTQIV